MKIKMNKTQKAKALEILNNRKEMCLHNMSCYPMINKATPEERKIIEEIMEELSILDILINNTK